MPKKSKSKHKKKTSKKEVSKHKGESQNVTVTKPNKSAKIKDLLKKIATSIVPIGGEKIIDILHNKKNVNEFLISKKLDLTINQTRNILYKLLDFGLVKFIRKKDKKKGGWYTYFWTLQIRKALELLNTQLSKKIEELDDNLHKRKNERFYLSPGANIEYTEEEALEHDFICPETGEVLEIIENSKLVDQLEIETSRLKLLIEEVGEELTELGKKEDKAKEKRLALEAKQKEIERKERREKLRKKRELEAKKSGKKKPAKKKVKKKVKKTSRSKKKTKGRSPKKTPNKAKKKSPKRTKKK